MPEKEWTFARIWLAAIRPLTLPLGFAAICLGYALAFFHGRASFSVFILALITALLLQILSNLANDYGDGLSGVDTKERRGPKRFVSSGLVSPGQMLAAVVLVGFFATLSGLALLYVAFWGNWLPFFAFLTLGIASVFAALAYTLGKRPYGYRGYGDIMAGLFFGPIAVLGTAILCGLPILSSSFALAILPALAAGFCSTAVLNINNIRDIPTDSATGKKTVAVKLGLYGALRYHLALTAGIVLCWVLFWLIAKPIFLWTLLLVLPICLATFRVFQKPSDPPSLVRQLIATNFSSAFLNMGMSLALFVASLWFFL